MPSKTYMGHTYARSECTQGGKYVYELDDDFTDCTSEAAVKELIKNKSEWESGQCPNCMRGGFCSGPYDPSVFRRDEAKCPRYQSCGGA